MLPRSDIEAIVRPTSLYIIYSTVSVQHTNLLPENASQKVPFSQKSVSYISDHLAMLMVLWLCNHHTIYYHIDIICKNDTKQVQQLLYHDIYC